MMVAAICLGLPFSFLNRLLQPLFDPFLVKVVRQGLVLNTYHITEYLEMTHKVTALAATSQEMFLGVIELGLDIAEQVSHRDLYQLSHMVLAIML